MSPRHTFDGATQRVQSTETSGSLGLLVVFSDGVATFPLPESGELTLGRARDADLQVGDESLSRRHAAFRVEAGQVQVKDLGSQNGTKVNKQTVAADWVSVAVGDALKLGEVTAVLQKTPAARPQRRLWGHTYFEARLEEECGSGGGPFAVVRIHLEHGGPLELQAAETISRALGPRDALARYGEGELEAILLGVNDAQAPERADALVAALEPLGTPVRAGVACFPRDGREADRLIARACAEVLRAGTSVTVQTGTTKMIIAAPAMRRLYEMVDRVAPGEISVLIHGETGSGKELVARALHDRSPRSKKPYLAINCGAFAESLLESELFGHEKGAFTGASDARAGLFESTQGGTVFLDEVGELPPSTQVKLLRVLEEKAVRRVGSNKSKPIDVRFVAATHRNLENEVKAGRFRQDLFFRISAVTLWVPPLRERREELAPLAKAFSATASAQLSRGPVPISADALDAMSTYSWPGNIRELKNVIERAVLLADSAIRPEHLPLDKMKAVLLDATPAPLPRLAAPKDADAERDRIVAALAECGGNQTQAAQRLGISRRTLVHRLNEYALPRPKKKV